MLRIDKTFWRISPVLGNGGTKWTLSSVSMNGSQAVITSTIGWYKTIKAAKAAASHLDRSPIDFPCQRRVPS